MGKIPDGIAPHVIFNMDGRIWLENFYSAGLDTDDPRRKLLNQQKIDRGWVTPIPQDKLEAFVHSVLQS